MSPSDRGVARRWVYAAKPMSWPKLLVPTLLGQAIGVLAAGEVCGTAVALGLAFTVCDLLYVVFLNDWGDRRVDRIKREMFPEGCSPKTIPDGILPAAALLLAGLAAGAAALGVAWAANSLLDRPALPLAAAGCLGMFVAYSLPPVRLNYRGGGEWLEMLGVGVALPWFHAYLQSGRGMAWGLWILPGFALLCLASALASGLADEESDREGGKTTYTTERGNEATRRQVERLVLAAAMVWAITSHVPGVAPRWCFWLAVAVVLINWQRLRRCSARASTNAFREQARYKRILHNAVWRGGLIMMLGALFEALR